MIDHTTNQPAVTKTCTTCKESKPATVEYYYRDKNRQDGFSPQCKACHRAYHALHKEREKEYDRLYYLANKEQDAQRAHAYYELHKEEIKRRTRSWRLAHLERDTNYHQAYRLANRDRINESKRNRLRKKREARPAIDVQSLREESKRRKRERQRAFRLANKEYVKARQRAWREVNREKVRSNVRHRKAMRRNAEGTHTAADIEHQYKAQKGKCYYCKAKVGDTYHVDHVVPLSRGGSNGPENIVIACPSCNQSKSDRMPHEWPEGGRLL